MTAIEPMDRRLQVGCRTVLRRGLRALPLLAAVAWPGAGARAEDAAGAGEAIYRQRCASCHGEAGEGVKGKHPDPLAGDKPLPDLARYIAESMPDDAPGTCAPGDAEKVARYIYDAFYSPVAQARRRAARIEPSRLTVDQYRNAVADLVAGFRTAGRPEAGAAAEKVPGAEQDAGGGAVAERGLRGEYFNSGRPGRRSVKVRTDAQVRFAFGRSDPQPEGLDAPGFTARWEGSVSAPETGDYELLVRTDHAARLWLNDPGQPLIDAWVKSGSDTEYRASIFLLGGRDYPLKLEFSSRRQGVDEKKKEEVKQVEAFIELHWKPPQRVSEVIPTHALSPRPASEVFVARTPFPPDDRSDGYERGTSISRAWDEATTRAAMETAAHVVAHLDELAGARNGGAERPSRVRGFCLRLVERAFRRPLPIEEQDLYVDRQFDGAPDLEAAVTRVVLLALKSPRFLYLDSGGRQPDSYAAASRLSFALWDSLPDRELLAAAAAGRLATREQAAAQAERMLDDPRTRAKVRRFLHQWLGVETAPDLTKDEKRFPGFDAALASDLRASLDLFLDEVVWGENPDFRRLFLSSDMYLNGRVGRYYGFDLPADAPFQKVGAERPERTGVLSHAYLMARFAYRDAGSPIHRGVFLLRGVLGRALRPPPEAFAPLPLDLHPDLTTRERVALQTAPASCQSCHGMINALGFALERFDAVGRYREEEGGKSIDASGSYRPSTGGTRTFTGARELAEFLAGSDEVHRAFVLQLFRYLVKQPLQAYRPEAAAELERVFASCGFNVRKLLAGAAATAAEAGSRESPLAPPAAGAYNHGPLEAVRLRRF